MKLTKSQLKKIEKYAFQNAEKDGMPHDKDHIEAVTHWAVYIAKKEKADVKVCRVAALLHDIANKKYGAKNHEEKSAKMAKKFLSSLKLDKDFIMQVTHAIECHDTSHVKEAKTREAQIIYEADKTEAISIKGFLRLYLHYVNNKGRTQSEALERYKIIQARLYKYIKTKTGKSIFKESRIIISHFLKEYKIWK